MQSISPKDQYNRYTLRLRDPRLYGPFHKFTLDEIQFTMPYLMILSVGAMLNAISLVEKKVHILLNVIPALLLLIIYMSRQRCRKFLKLNLLLLSIVWYACIVFTHGDTSYQDQQHLETAFKLTLMRIGEDSLIFFLFAANSYKWLVAFQVIFVAANIFLSIT